MIVTRQRRKKFPWRRVLLPLLAIVLLVAAVSWAPSRNFMANGPLAPVIKAAAPGWNAMTAPLRFEAQNKILGDQKQQIAALQKQLDDAKKQIGDRDKQISALTTQLNDAQQQLALKSSAPAGPVKKAATPSMAASTAVASANDLSSGASADMRRTAQVWGAMDAEAAAKVVQRLPVAYVARVMAVMSPDTVGPILEAVPPTYAAQLTREHPELQR